MVFYIDPNCNNLLLNVDLKTFLLSNGIIMGSFSLFWFISVVISFQEMGGCTTPFIISWLTIYFLGILSWGILFGSFLVFSSNYQCLLNLSGQTLTATVMVVLNIALEVYLISELILAIREGKEEENQRFTLTELA